jgi:hypothetical protein
MAPAQGEGDGSPPNPESRPRAASARVYEDVEIMRRLLDQKIQSQVPARYSYLPAWADARYCQSCHEPATAPYREWSRYLTTNQPSGVVNEIYLNPHTNNATWLNMWSTAVNRNWVAAHHGLSAAPRMEGVYLRNQGVVYTVTLPLEPGTARPQPPKPAAKPLSEWERLRREIRGEKPEAATPPPARKEPALADTLLKTMAENGHNFSELAANESVTVVVTFRPVSPAGAGQVSLDLDVGNSFWIELHNPAAPGLTPYTPATSTTTSAATSSAGGTTSTSTGTTTAARSTPSSARDYLLLGDLLLKQGKAQEAVAAYTNAGKLLETGSPAEGEKAEEQLRKLAQAYLAAGDVKGARTALDQLARSERSAAAKASQAPAAKGSSNARPAETPKPTPPPAKLIVSATKQVLDQVGSGKMSFEDFKKAATVQYLDFAPTGGRP